MPAIECMAPDVVGPFVPQRDRPFGVPVIERTLRAPQRQHRRTDFSARLVIAAIVDAIDIGGHVALAAADKLPDWAAKAAWPPGEIVVRVLPQKLCNTVRPLVPVAPDGPTP